MVARSCRDRLERKAAALSKASRTSSTVAFGTVPTSDPSQGLRTSMTRPLPTLWPAMRIDSRRMTLMGSSDGVGEGRRGGDGMVEGEVEGAEVAQLRVG